MKEEAPAQRGMCQGASGAILAQARACFRLYLKFDTPRPFRAGEYQYDRSLMKYRRILNPQKAAEREIIGVLDLYLDFYKYKLQSLQRNSTTNYEAVEKHLAVFGNKKAALVTGQQCVAFFKNFSNYAIGTRRSYLAILRAC